MYFFSLELIYLFDHFSFPITFPLVYKSYKCSNDASNRNDGQTGHKILIPWQCKEATNGEGIYCDTDEIEKKGIFLVEEEMVHVAEEDDEDYYEKVGEEIGGVFIEDYGWDGKE